MPKCIIDGREVEFKPGENLIEVAKRAGIEIPVFCYHPALSVVAQCRMCAVEIEKMPKLQTACSTAAQEGMVVKTKSDRAKQNQSSIMEFLLANHPLDCPICDKSGECDLQDNSFKYGDANTRYTEERRTYLDLDMGPVIKKNMNRCIHCTRCIRFGAEVAGVREMVAVKRGNNTEITTLDGRALETDYAGNYADICPTGSLTLKDFRFKKRVWYLQKTPSVCDGCSRGCNIEIHHENNLVYRLLPRQNDEVNKYWICDEGRFGFHFVNDEKRVTEPMMRNQSKLVESDWKSSVQHARNFLKGKSVTILVGSDLTQEEGRMLLEFLPLAFNKAPVFHFGTPGIRSSQGDAPADALLKRKSKTPNVHGLEKLGYVGFEKFPSGTDAVLVFSSGRADLPQFGSVATVGIGVFNQAQAEKFETVLPGVSFAEKEGTFVNFQGKEQKLMRALSPRGNAKQFSEILMMWNNV